MQKTCIIISGPTASGKTDRAIELALKHNADIISADSRQCFRELNIGVAKPTKLQLLSAKHYFINSHSIRDEVNAAVFESYASQAVAQIFQEHDTAILVGGTGLYIKAFEKGLDDVPPVNRSLREEITAAYEQNGIDWLRGEIERSDLLFLQKGEIQNPQRMIRALEVKKTTGKSILSFHSGNSKINNFRIEHLFLNPQRAVLYENINHRVDRMMAEGLLDEAMGLYPLRHLNALQTVGYRELFDFIEGKISVEQAIDDIKKNTRHYAKRQITWFKKYIPAA